MQQFKQAVAAGAEGGGGGAAAHICIHCGGRSSGGGGAGQAWGTCLLAPRPHLLNSACLALQRALQGHCQR